MLGVSKKRWIVLGLCGLVGLSVATGPNVPGVAAVEFGIADSNGCVTQFVMPAGTIVGYAELRVRFTLKIPAYPTTVVGQWGLSNGATGSQVWFGPGPYHSNVSSTVEQPGLGVVLAPGSSGTATFVLTRPASYGTCFEVSNAVVTKTPRTEGGGGVETPAPGGGGVVAPSPTPTPSAPPSRTQPPSGDPPPPPEGWCYVPMPYPGPEPGEELPMVPCDWDALPSEPPDDWDLDCTFGTGSCADGVPAVYLNVGGTVKASWLISSGPGGGYVGALICTTSNGTTVDTGACFSLTTGSTTNLCWNAGSNSACSDGTQANPTRVYAVPDTASWGGAAARGTAKRVLAWCFLASGGGNASSRCRVELGDATAYGGGAWDVDDPAGAAPSPTPTPSLPSPTLPPGWGTPPPIDIDVDVDVDICEDDPGIVACQTVGPVGSPDTEGAFEAWEGVYDHLMSKAPFGYAHQVITAIGDAAENAPGGGVPGGGDCFMCLDMPVYDPTAPERTRTVTLDIPAEDVAGWAAPFRSVLLAILTILVAVGVLRWALRATGGSGGGGSSD